MKKLQKGGMCFDSGDNMAKAMEEQQLPSTGQEPGDWWHTPTPQALHHRKPPLATGKFAGYCEPLLPPSLDFYIF